MFQSLKDAISGAMGKENFDLMVTIVTCLKNAGSVALGA
jgi:hypothetical protein